MRGRIEQTKNVLDEARTRTVDTGALAAGDTQVLTRKARRDDVCWR
jgi:hypothetical protein